MSKVTVEDIARVCHEANRAVQIISGDPVVSAPWERTPEEIQESSVRGVEAALAGVSSRTLHEAWMKDKEAAGWIYGPEKSMLHKTHPCMVDYDDLPEEDRIKDDVFNAIVRAFATSPLFDGKLARRKGDGTILLTEGTDG